VANIEAKENQEEAMNVLEESTGPSFSRAGLKSEGWEGLSKNLVALNLYTVCISYKV
jgi:hypothetical protein